MALGPVRLFARDMLLLQEKIYRRKIFNLHSLNTAKGPESRLPGQLQVGKCK